MVLKYSLGVTRQAPWSVGAFGDKVVHVSREEMNSIRRMAAARKAKREEKRRDLPWGEPPDQEPPPGPWTKGRKLKTGTFKGYLVVKRPSRTVRQMLRDRLDDLWAYFIKLRDKLAYGGVCRICGVRGIEVAYHIIPRGDDATRWDFENGCGACHECNRGEQMNRSRYRAKHVVIFGAELIERLEAKARTRPKFSLEDLERIKTEIILATQQLTKK